MSTQTLAEQYLLRVRKNSDLDIVLREFQKRGTMTNEDIDGLGTQYKTAGILSRLAKYFDNLNINRADGDYRANYVNVMPTQVQVVTSDVNFSGVESSGSVSDVSSGEIKWQLAPPMIESLGDSFDRPSWFNTMRKMVQLGRHISLEGPPGVGKDTAVQELAAIEGKVLVTLGGDGGFRKRDLTGSPQIANGTSFWEAGEYVTAAVNGWWVLITEINAADADALIYLNSQLAAPYIVTLNGKAYPVHPDFRLFISYNAGLVGTKPMPQSLKDRFFSIRVPFFTESQLTRRLEKMIGDQYVEFLTSPASALIVKFGIEMWNAHLNGKFNYQITSRRLYDACALVIHFESNVKSALVDAVLSVIDSKVELKAAQTLLNDFCNRHNVL